LITVPKLKFLNTDTLTVVRVNAIKDNLGIWRQATTNGLETVDFTGFDFNPNQGTFRSTLVFVTHPTLTTRLFVQPLESDTLGKFALVPVCQAPKIATAPQCQPDPDCYGNGDCKDGQCHCNQGYRPQEGCFCKDSKTTVVFSDELSKEKLSNVLVSYVKADGASVHNLTNELGQLVITGCADKVITFTVEGFCGDATITTKPGMKSTSVTLSKETNLVVAIVDLANGDPVKDVTVDGIGDSSEKTNGNGNWAISSENCQKIGPSTLNAIKDGYCSNSLKINEIVGETDIKIIPIAPKLSVSVSIHNTIGEPISGATLEALKKSEVSDSNGEIFYEDVCHGTIANFEATKKGYCKSSTKVELDEIKFQFVNLEMRHVASLVLEVYDKANFRVVKNLKVIFEVFEAGKISSKTEELSTNSEGQVKLKALCEGYDVKVTVASGELCQGSYVFFRISKFSQKVSFFVDCS